MEPTCDPPESPEEYEVSKEDDICKSAPYCEAYLVRQNENALQIEPRASDQPTRDFVGEKASTADDPCQGWWSTQEYETTPRALPPHRKKTRANKKGADNTKRYRVRVC